MKCIFVTVIGILGAMAWAPVSPAMPLHAPLAGLPHLQTVRGVGREKVREAQSLLVRLGYDLGVPDGISGAHTRAAVRAFQRDSELPATGAITAALLDELHDKVSRPAAPPQSAPVLAPQGGVTPQINRGPVTLVAPLVAAPVRARVLPSAAQFSASPTVLLAPSAPATTRATPKTIDRGRPVSLIAGPSRQQITAVPRISAQPFISQPAAPALAPPPPQLAPLAPLTQSSSPPPPPPSLPVQTTGAGAFGWDTPPPAKQQAPMLQVSAPISTMPAAPPIPPAQQVRQPSLLAPQPLIVTAPAAMPAPQAEPERRAIAPPVLRIDRAPPPPRIPAISTAPAPATPPPLAPALQPSAQRFSQALPSRPQAVAPAPPIALSGRAITPDMAPSAPAALPATPQPRGLLASAPGFRETETPPLGLSGITGQTWRFTDDNGAEMELLFEEDSKISGPAFAEAMTWSLEGGEMWLLYETALGGRSARRGRMSGPNAMTGQGESNRRGDHGETRHWTWRAVRVR